MVALRKLFCCLSAIDDDAEDDHGQDAGYDAND